MPNLSSRSFFLAHLFAHRAFLLTAALTGLVSAGCGSKGDGTGMVIPDNPGTGGGDAKSYYAISDGAAVGSGTWPTFTPGSFTSDVWDMSTGTPELADSDATVLWFSLDALQNAGAPVECVKLSNGSYRGTLEHCTPIPADGA